MKRNKHRSPKIHCQGVTENLETLSNARLLQMYK